VLSKKDDKKELCQTALDKSVDIDKIKARTEDGILYVTLPRAKKSSGKVVEVV
jgi:HSP20 family molecular chaperone IbpA